MRKLLLLYLLQYLNSVTESTIIEHSINGSLSEDLVLRCPGHLSEIYITSSEFGYIGNTEKSSCTYSVGRNIRRQCNRKNVCEVSVLKSDFIRPNEIKCNNVTPKLYTKYICVNRAASLVSLRDASRKKSGFLQPTQNKNGLTSETRKWETDEFCMNFPRYIHFKLIDLNLLSCDMQNFTIMVNTTNGYHFARFCGDDIDDYKGNRSFGYTNFTEVTFKLRTKTTFPEKRGFVMKFIAMQCNPISIPKNAKIEYNIDAGSESEKRVMARVNCKAGFVPKPGTPSEVTLQCGGNECYIYECPEDDKDFCDPTWSPPEHVTKLKKMQCVKPSALTTTTSTTTTPTTTTATTQSTTTTTLEPSTASTTTRVSTSTAPVTSSVILIESSTNSNKRNTTTVDSGVKVMTNTSVLPSFTPPGKVPEKQSQLVIIAGTIGGVAGFAVCLIFIVLLLMICKKSKTCLCARYWCCGCLEGFFYDKADYSMNQSHLGASVDDSTMAVRYRVESASTRLDASSIQSNNNRSSLARSSTIGSLAFSSYRRNKKKPVHPLPHPSQLGAGPYDEMVPLCRENGSVWSPSVETYLEPNRRPSTSSMGATGTGRRSDPKRLGKFHPKSKSSSEYQVYDENRSSRMALDRFDAPSMDPRHSQALLSNHYYSQEDFPVNSDDISNKRSDCESVYESVDDDLSSISSYGELPSRGGRRFTAATRNEYVQPPALPERPPGMDRSSHNSRIVSIQPDEDEDGYQPVNVQSRMNV